MKNKIKITESQLEYFGKRKLIESVYFDTVFNNVISFLNNNYEQSTKQVSNGSEYITKPCVTKKVDKTAIDLRELLDYTESRPEFRKLNVDFIKQCIIDWYNGDAQNKKFITKNIPLFNESNDIIKEGLFQQDNSIKPYEKILIDSVIKFMKRKLGFESNIVVRKKLDQKFFGDIILSHNNVNNNKFTVHFNPNVGVDYMVSSLIHELTHVKQAAKGELKLSQDAKSLVWKDDMVLSGREYNKLMKDWDTYSALPWEAEAYGNQETLLPEFFNSPEFTSLKDSKEPNISFIVKNKLEESVTVIKESTDNKVYSGAYVNNYIKDITPDDSETPTWFMNKLIKPRKFKLETVKLNDLLYSDPSFKEFYENNDEDRYDFDEVDPNDLFNYIVVVDGELLDGYSRASTLLKNGERETQGFVAI